MGGEGSLHLLKKEEVGGKDMKGITKRSTTWLWSRFWVFIKRHPNNLNEYICRAVYKL